MCQEMDEYTYAFLSKDNPQIHWYCSHCRYCSHCNLGASKLFKSINMVNSALTERINLVETKVHGVRDDLGARVKLLEDKPDNRKDIDMVQEILDKVEKFISDKQAVGATGGAAEVTEGEGSGPTVQDLRDEESRKNNLIIYRVHESDDKKVGEDHDEGYMMELVRKQLDIPDIVRLARLRDKEKHQEAGSREPHGPSRN